METVMRADQGTGGGRDRWRTGLRQKRETSIRPARREVRHSCYQGSENVFSGDRIEPCPNAVNSAHST